MIAGAGYFADDEGAPRPALDVRGPLAGRHAILGAVDAGDGLAADYNGNGPVGWSQPVPGFAPPGRLFVPDETSGRLARLCAHHDNSSSR
jgi:hypothetical protein